MSYFIIIRGPLGAGKSTIARELARILDGEHISFDTLLEEHGLDKIDPEAGCIPAMNFVRANEIILQRAKDMLAQGKIIVFDACFYHKDALEHLIQSLPYPHHVFTLNAPVEVCIERDSKREKAYGEGAARAVHGLVSRFDFGTVIDISDKDVEQTVKEVLSHLPKF